MGIRALKMQSNDVWMMVYSISNENNILRKWKKLNFNVIKGPILSPCQPTDGASPTESALQAMNQWGESNRPRLQS